MFFSSPPLLHLSLLVLLLLVSLPGPSCGGPTPICFRQTYQGTLSVTIVRAWNLKGDPTGKTEAYVKMWYDNIFRSTNVVRSNYPSWNSCFNLGKVNTRATLRVELWDEDVWHDDRLGYCTFNLRRGTRTHTCSIKNGGFEIKYTLSCDRNLTGDKCECYKKSP